MVTYLSMDSLAEGVGASQVLRYVERLAIRGVPVVLHTFEKEPPQDELRTRLADVGVRWHPHRFGRFGPRGGLGRVIRAARYIRGANLVHARTHIAAAAALIARPRRWVWDVRSFWTDQRIAVGALKPGSPEERVLRWVERQSAKTCDSIVTLTRAAAEMFAERYGNHVRQKTHVVPTCVDLDRFVASPLPGRGRLRFLLSGTINAFYDVPGMLRLVEKAAQRGQAELELLTPRETAWETEFRQAGIWRLKAEPDEVPEHVQASHVGLSVCRSDMGASLRAAMPTKLGEFLASGRPVVVNRGLGDMDHLLAEHDCGVVLEGTGDLELDRAVDRLEQVLDDPELPARCRSLAERHFDLDRGIDTLAEIYESLS